MHETAERCWNRQASIYDIYWRRDRENMMPDVAFAIKFIVLLTAFIAGFSVAIYAFASVVAAFRKLFNANKNKNARSVRSNENEKENLE
jgi:phosphoglycerate dehydrogenase-like enzyme